MLRSQQRPGKPGMTTCDAGVMSDTSSRGRSASQEPAHVDYSHRLADFLREQAQWRRDVAKRHDDGGSLDSARGFDKAALEIEQIDDDHPWIALLVDEGWLTAAGFQPEGEPASRYLRQFNRYEDTTSEQLLFSLAIF